MAHNAETSTRIAILRFPLIAGVVFGHNYETIVPLSNGSVGVMHSSAWVDFIRIFISGSAARIVVPTFFLICGYLFFLGGWSWEKYLGKLKRRFHSLFIPLVFWNLLTLALFALAQSIPQTKMYFAGSVWPPVRSFSLMDYVNALFGITVKFPVAFQFWFIRDLITMILAAPVLYFILSRRLALLFILALSWFWFINACPVLWPSIEAVFFFCLGAYLSCREKDVMYLDKYGPWMSIGFVCLLIVHTARYGEPWYLLKLLIAFGVPSVWWLAGQAYRAPRLKSLLMQSGNASFFVFAAHEPLLMIVRKLLYKLLLPTSAAAILALYLLIPICIIAVLMLIYHLLQKTMPSLVATFSGNRRRPEKQSA